MSPSAALKVLLSLANPLVSFVRELVKVLFYCTFYTPCVRGTFAMGTLPGFYASFSFSPLFVRFKNFDLD